MPVDPIRGGGGGGAMSDLSGGGDDGIRGVGRYCSGGGAVVWVTAMASEAFVWLLSADPPQFEQACAKPAVEIPH